MEKVIETRQEVLEFLQVDECHSGYGYGNGYGDGYSDGSGSNSCSGYGSGSGSGSGSGYGDGYGYGPAYGYGDYCGSGYGDGSDHVPCSGYGRGDSYGSGYGYGDFSRIESINGIVVQNIDNIYTIIESVHGNFAKGYILKDDLTTKSCYIAKYGNYFAHGDTIKEAFYDAKEKYNENAPIEKRIERFNNQYPDRDKKVPANELFNWHHTLTGSCFAGRKYFCDDHSLDYKNGEYSVNEFIALTKDSYNGYIIKLLEDSKP